MIRCFGHDDLKSMVNDEKKKEEEEEKKKADEERDREIQLKEIVIKRLLKNKV